MSSHKRVELAIFLYVNLCRSLREEIQCASKAPA